MHSVRRAVLRAAGPSSRVLAVPRQQIASFAMQMGKQNMRPTATMLLARSFSQTPRAAEQEPSTGSPLESSQTESQRSRDGPSIYVGNLSYEATEIHIREAFGKYGEITNVNVIRDAQGRSKGYAFVVFSDKEIANAAVEGSNQSFWLGRRINVNISQQQPNAGRSASSRGSTEPTENLYIGNIPYETSDADLNAVFRDLDGVKDVRVAVDRNTGWPRGFAHADFESIEAASLAKEKLESMKLGGRDLRIDFAVRQVKTGRPQRRD